MLFSCVNALNFMDMPRVMTWGIFELKDNPSVVFIYINCHLDHLFNSNRMRQIELAAQCAEDLSQCIDGPCLIGGDFNAVRSSPEARYLTEHEKLKFEETWIQVHDPADEGFTYHAFKGPMYVPVGENDLTHIDFIFISIDSGWKIMKSKVIKDSIQDDTELAEDEHPKYPSDHYPIMTTFSCDPSKFAVRVNYDFQITAKWKATM